MKWPWTPADSEIEDAKKSADQIRLYVEDAEKVTERLVKERAVTDLVARENRRRWKNHLDSNGWSEIMEDQIRKAMRRGHP